MLNVYLNNPLNPTLGEGIGSVLGVVVSFLIAALVLGFLVWLIWFWKPKGSTISQSRLLPSQKPPKETETTSGEKQHIS